MGYSNVKPTLEERELSVRSSLYYVELEGCAFSTGSIVVCFKNIPIVSKVLGTSDGDKYLLCSEFAGTASNLSSSESNVLYEKLYDIASQNTENRTGKDVIQLFGDARRYIGDISYKFTREAAGHLMVNEKGDIYTTKMVEIKPKKRFGSSFPYDQEDKAETRLSKSKILDSSGNPLGNTEVAIIAHIATDCNYTDMANNVKERKLSFT